MNLNFFQKIKNFLILSVSFAIKKFFLFSLALLVIIFLLAGLIFYKYAYKVSAYPDAQASSELRIDSALYQKVFSRLEEKKKAFEESSDIQVSDPFAQ